MFDRSPARVLAPIALCVFFIAAIVVIADSGDSPTKSRSGQTATTDGGKKQKHFYRVKSGETLTTIAEKTDVDIETLEALNPDIDPQSLQEGQLIRLRKGK